MKNNNSADMTTLPMNAFREIPTPTADAKQIVGLVKHSGRVSGYQLSDGRILSKTEGITLARQGGIMGVGIATRRGNEYLKSIPDENQTNNLGNLPTVSG